MTAIIKNNFKLQNARDFLENFTVQSSTRNHYLFIGKPTVWGTGSQNEELNPPVPQDTEYEEQRVWDEMLSLKKIDSANVSLVVPRSDWAPNTIYAVYDDRDSNLYKQPTIERSQQAGLQGKLAGNFYVINDQFDVFVCLNNNNNNASTLKPVRPTSNPGTNLVDYSTTDGYVWKYMATLTASDVTKFVTDSWIPVQTLTSNDGTKENQWAVQTNAVAGQVVSIQLDNQGTGYTNTYSGKFQTGTILNDGGLGKAFIEKSSPSDPDPSTTAGAYAGGQIHIITGADAGSVYTIQSYSASGQITLTGPWLESGGSPIVQPTSTFRILPRVDVVSNGTTSLKIRPVIVGAKFDRFEITDRGTGATFVQITIPNTLGGSGAIARAVLSPSYSGLGADIERDLGAFFVLLNARLQFDEGLGDFPVTNDYRQLGIIRDVRDYNTTTLSTAPTLIATKKLTLSGVVGDPLTFDEIFQQGTGVKARVLDYKAAAGLNPATITFIQNPTTGYGSFVVGQQIQGTASLNPFTATITAITNEEVNKKRGEILYQENRRAVLRAPDQIEDIKAIIEF